MIYLLIIILAVLWSYAVSVAEEMFDWPGWVSVVLIVVGAFLVGVAL